MTHERTCGSCGKKFHSQNIDSIICYGCALKRLIGNGGPEEGDINSALLTSGEMTDEDARCLQEDLESVDHARAEVALREMVEDYDDSGRWNYLEDYDEDE